VVILGLACLLVLPWYLGKGIFENFVRCGMPPWAVVQVPENPTPLADLDAKVVDNMVALCHRSDGDWNKVLVQID
jgi:hypothetical protein